MDQIVSLNDRDQFSPRWQAPGPLIERARLESWPLLQMEKLERW
ncbi:hypothetical protein [Thermogemmatispora tikiterensis]|nr:hypothetical protein [Thermogemmatispora tikiterensis]